MVIDPDCIYLREEVLIPVVQGKQGLYVLCMCQNVAHTTLLFFVYRDHTFVYREILAKIHLTETMCVKHQYYSLTHIILIISSIVISPLILIRFLLLVQPKEYNYHARKRVSKFILRSYLDCAIKSTLRVLWECTIKLTSRGYEPNFLGFHLRSLCLFLLSSV